MHREYAGGRGFPDGSSVRSSPSAFVSLSLHVVIFFCISIFVLGVSLLVLLNGLN
jgi:hypothetical protein